MKFRGIILNQETLLGAGGTFLIVGLVQLIKNAGLPDRLAPAIAVLIGLALTTGYTLAYTVDVGGPNIFESIVNGIILGLSASGLYSGVQTAVKGPTILREKDTEEYDVVVGPKGSITVEESSPPEDNLEEDI